MIQELEKCLNVLRDVAVRGDDKARLLAVENCLIKIIQDGSKANQIDKQAGGGDKGGDAAEQRAPSDNAGASLEG